MDSAPLRTKIVATIGPASRNPAILRGLSDAGVTVFRLNFSHGSYEEHSSVLQQIRALGRETGQHFAVLLDLCGPKIRNVHSAKNSFWLRIGYPTIPMS
jgi:pyruvate kinase